MLRFMKTATIASLAISAAAASSVCAATDVKAGGATFPNPLYTKWIGEYQKTNSNVRIDYQSQGSGFGIKGLVSHQLDFAGSDAPMNDKEKTAAKGDVVHIPTCAGGVVPAFNLPGLRDLNLTGEVIAKIYLGQIAKWNDPAIKELNAGVDLPDMAITPVYRTDSSGTSFVFTSYLATQSDAFKSQVGTGKAVEWPVGQGNKGNPGIAATVSSTPGAIGYMELNYASENKIAFASVKNKDGKFVKASPDSISAAGAGAVKEMEKGDLAVDIWNQPGEKAYPISSFTYMLVYKDMTYLNDKGKAAAIVKFINWGITDGQKYCADLGYAPLAPEVVKMAQQAVAGLSYGDKPVAMK